MFMAGRQEGREGVNGFGAKVVETGERDRRAREASVLGPGV
jgi:hypothetical protein